LNIHLPFSRRPSKLIFKIKMILRPEFKKFPVLSKVGWLKTQNFFGEIKKYRRKNWGNYRFEIITQKFDGISGYLSYHTRDSRFLKALKFEFLPFSIALVLIS